MSEEKNKAPWYHGLFKVLFFVLAFFLIMFTVLANISGNSDFYKESIEQYAQSATGYHAQVGKLNKVSFFPTVMFDFEDLELRQSPGDDTPLASISSVLFKVGFWDVALGTGYIKALEVTDAKALPGAFLKKSVAVKSASIDENYLDKEASSAALVIDGTIGDQPLKAHVDLDVSAGSAFWGQDKKFRFANAKNFHVKAADIEVSGHVDNGVFRDLKLIHRGQEALTGEMALKQKGHDQIVLQGDLILPEHGTHLKPDLKFRMKDGGLFASGRVNTPAFHLEDTKESARISRFIKNFQALFGKEEKGFSFPAEYADLTLNFEQFLVGGHDLGRLDVPLQLKDKKLSLVLDNEFMLSHLKGDVVLEAAEAGPALDLNLNFKDFDYGALQARLAENTEVSGTADVALVLKGQAADLYSLKSNLSGNFTFIGGAGKLRSGFINLWGGGLVNAILPDFSGQDRFQVNCAIMDFKIKGGIAESSALFMDTEILTLAGEGTYDIAKDNLDITLTPKKKELAIGDISSSVSIAGSLSEPTIAPSLIGFGRKIGTLLLGAVNPAFLAIGLADLGLSEDHPCAAYMKAEEPVSEVPAVARDQEESE